MAYSRSSRINLFKKAVDPSAASREDAKNEFLQAIRIPSKYISSKQIDYTKSIGPKITKAITDIESLRKKILELPQDQDAAIQVLKDMFAEDKPVTEQQTKEIPRFNANVKENRNAIEDQMADLNNAMKAPGGAAVAEANPSVSDIIKLALTKSSAPTPMASPGMGSPGAGPAGPDAAEPVASESSVRSVMQAINIPEILRAIGSEDANDGNSLRGAVRILNSAVTKLAENPDDTAIEPLIKSFNESKQKSDEVFNNIIHNVEDVLSALSALANSLTGEATQTKADDLTSVLSGISEGIEAISSHVKKEWTSSKLPQQEKPKTMTSETVPEQKPAASRTKRTKEG